MSLIEECVKDSLPLWERCLQTEFLRGVADGTLPEACFKGYIVDDSLYLREYARVFAWAMLRAKTSGEIRALYSMLSFVNDTEGTTRHAYLKRYGLTDDGVQHLPLRRENRAYVDGMMALCAAADTAGACMMAALPCLLSYQWIFGEMLRCSPECRSGPYGPFVGDYDSGRYEKICREWSAFSDALCAPFSESERRRCIAQFRSFSEHEYAFWQMSGKPRSDV